jgi:hypothetical protein
MDVSATFGGYVISIDNPSGLYSTRTTHSVKIKSMELKSTIRMAPTWSAIQPMAGVAVNNRWLSHYSSYAYNTVTKDYNQVKTDLAYKMGGIDLIVGLEYAFFYPSKTREELRISISYRNSIKSREFVPFLGAELTLWY